MQNDISGLSSDLLRQTSFPSITASTTDKPIFHLWNPLCYLPKFVGFPHSFRNVPGQIWIRKLVPIVCSVKFNFSNFTFLCFWKVSLYRIMMKIFYKVKFCWMACNAMDVHRENLWDLLQELVFFLSGIRLKSDHWFEGLIYQQWWIVITHNSFTIVSCVLYP